MLVTGYKALDYSNNIYLPYKPTPRHDDLYQKETPDENLVRENQRLQDRIEYLDAKIKYMTANNKNAENILSFWKTIIVPAFLSISGYFFRKALISTSIWLYKNCRDFWKRRKTAA